MMQFKNRITNFKETIIYGDFYWSKNLFSAPGSKAAFSSITLIWPFMAKIATITPSQPTPFNQMYVASSLWRGRYSFDLPKENQENPQLLSKNLNRLESVQEDAAEVYFYHRVQTVI